VLTTNASLETGLRAYGRMDQNLAAGAERGVGGDIGRAMNDRQRQEARIDQPIMQLQPDPVRHRRPENKAPGAPTPPASGAECAFADMHGMPGKGAATSALSNTAMILSSVSYRHSFQHPRLTGFPPEDDFTHVGSSPYAPAFTRFVESSNLRNSSR